MQEWSQLRHLQHQLQLSDPERLERMLKILILQRLALSNFRPLLCSLQHCLSFRLSRCCLMWDLQRSMVIVRRLPWLWDQLSHSKLRQQRLWSAQDWRSVLSVQKEK